MTVIVHREAEIEYFEYISFYEGLAVRWVLASGGHQVFGYRLGVVLLILLCAEQSEALPIW